MAANKKTTAKKPAKKKAKVAAKKKAAKALLATECRVVLVSRGPNTHAVCAVEQQYGHSCQKPVPYVFHVTPDPEECEALAAQLRSLGANATCTCD